MTFHWKQLIASALLGSLVTCCGSQPEFSTVLNGHFFRSGVRQDFIGTNFWYGPILGSEGFGGKRERLVRELDSLKSLGITNLRVLAGGDGPQGQPQQIYPSLQEEPGVYNDSLFVGLDFFMAEIAKRDMQAVLYLNNAWGWSGGYNVYLRWAARKEGKELGTWINSSEFYTNETAKQLFWDNVRNIVSRRNSITGKLYKDDPAIFSWQFANEPRPFSRDSATVDAFCDFIWKTASYIKSLDPNHMFSTGNEGSMGCNDGDLALAERLNSCPDIDYVTIHIWPSNWNWAHAATLQEDFRGAVFKTDNYIDGHIAICEKFRKPMVIEEFGFPRDGGELADGTPTTLKDAYYKHVFDRLISSRNEGGVIAGVNFWGWGGFAKRPDGHTDWRPGDDYGCDPAQEPQGLFSVYANDESTIAVIKDAAAAIAAPYATAVLENDWMLDGQKPLRFALGNVGTTPAALELRLSSDKGEPMGEWSQIAMRNDTLSFSFDLPDGFYKVDASVNGSGLKPFVIGFGNPEKVVSAPDKAGDFDEFWDRSLKELAAVAPQYRLTLLAEHSNEVRRSYRVDMKSWGGVPISALLIEPVKEGKFPVYINYLGYNCDPWFEDPSANPETIKIWLCTRGQGFNRDLSEPADFVTRGLKSPETYYYHGAFLDVVRGVDLACSREKADLGRVFAEGGSQGGAFTLISAALDPRIKAIACFVPFLNDFPDYFKVAQWPGNEILPAAKRLGINDEDLYKTLSYVDVKNFTDRIKCPVIMGFGLQDDTCPPHTNFAGYNNLGSSGKSWICFPLSGHHVEREPGWNAARDAFFARYDRP